MKIFTIVIAMGLFVLFNQLSQTSQISSERNFTKSVTYEKQIEGINLDREIGSLKKVIKKLGVQ